MILFLATGVLTARAEHLEYRSAEQRLARLESEFASLSSQLTALPEKQPAACALPFTEPCCRASGIVGGAALVFAHPWTSADVAFEESTTEVTLTTVAPRKFDYDFVATPRVWLGYQNASGRGIRARYWQFDSDARLTSITDDGVGTEIAAKTGIVGTDLLGELTTIEDESLIAVQGLRLDVVDLEYTQRIRPYLGDWTLSAGVRYMRYEQTYEVNAPPSFNQFLFSSYELEGIGPTVALEALLPSRWYGLQLYGAGRASVLFSRMDQLVIDTVGGTFGNRYVADDRDQAVGVFETEWGLRWQREMRGGATFFAQGSVEAQLWTETAHSGNDVANLGFFGIGAALGIAR
jgi:hypothetical protein